MRKNIIIIEIMLVGILLLGVGYLVYNNSKNSKDTINSSKNSASISLATKDGLLNSFKQGLKAKDVNALLKLFYWQEVTSETKKLTTEVLQDLTAQTIDNLSLNSSQKTEKIELNNKEQIPNLPVTGHIKLEYTTKSGVRRVVNFPYGELNGSFYLVQAVNESPVGISSTSTTDNTKNNNTNADKYVNIKVYGTMSPNPVSFTGYYIYVKDGKEYRENLVGNKGTHLVSFWAEYVKYCEITKINNEAGNLRFEILSNEKVIYSSKEVTDKTKLIYQK